MVERALLFIQFALLVTFMPNSNVVSTSEDTLSPIPEKSRVIHVNPNHGNDQKCQEEGGQVPCESLETANTLLDLYAHNVSIVLDEDVTLGAVFEVINSTNIQIIGKKTLQCHIKCLPGIAGFVIENVINFHLQNIAVINCTVSPRSNSFPHNFAMLIQLSEEITLKQVLFKNCSNTALVLVNNRGEVLLDHTAFVNNHNHLRPRKAPHNMVNFSHPGALSIQQNKWTTHIIITDSDFYYNESPKLLRDYAFIKTRKYIKYGYGGAVFVEFGGSTSESSISIVKSNFTYNTATKGGGIFGYFNDHAHNNSIHIWRCMFTANDGDISGGGVNLGYGSPTAIQNTIQITDCCFVKNSCLYGAGLTIFSVYSKKYSVQKHGPIISNSTWLKNNGVLSSAVDVAPLNQGIENEGFLPVPQFINCTFDQNFLEQPTEGNKTHHINTGTFSVTNFKVLFGGTAKFSSSEFSAVLLVSGIIEFQTGSNVLFWNNTGYNGGAIAMYSFSKVIFNPDLFVNFSRNHAINSGGAIYYKTSDQHTLLRGSTECFLKNRACTKKNISLVNSTKVFFEKNTAEVDGEAIYSQGFNSCYTMYRLTAGDKYPFSMSSIFRCIGDFIFESNNDKKPYITSSGRRFQFNENSTYSYEVIPGDRISLPFSIIDDFDNEVKPLLSISNTSSSVYASDQYSLTNTIQPLGETSAQSVFRVSVLSVRQIYFLFKVTLLPCPPGYHNLNGACTCAAYDEFKRKEGYQPIKKCDYSKFNAIYKGSQWFGYIPENSTEPTDLYYAHCVEPMCNESNTRLPRDQENLSSMVCHQHREGILCGRCAHNFSTYYHSRKFTCGPNDLCHLGPLFYVLSEIIPMVVFFLVVVILDLSFTSGKVTSFVFFTQYLSQLTVPKNPLFPNMSIPYRIFYGLFNLEYFNVEKLSFCLWEGAQILDIVAMRYVTVVIALGLVFLFIAVFNKSSTFMLQYLRRSVNVKASDSVVHGLSAFLVVCYAQCTETSVYILDFTRLHGYNYRLGDYYTFYGGLHYLHGKHLVYAVPAMISLVFVTILPPLVLLLYPLTLHLLSLCGLSEHWLVNKTLQLTGINKLKPFIDCFQGCYKDKLRFFAGLYFVYRVVFLLLFCTSEDSFHFSISSEIFLVILLSIHAVVRPYKESLHNTLDILILFNLALVNGYSIARQLRAWKFDPSDKYNEYNFQLVSWIQLCLTYIPMLIVVSYVVRAGQIYISAWWKCCHSQRQVRSVEVDDILDHDSERDSLVSTIQSTNEEPPESTYGSLEDTY